jgi:DNA-binding MarR family transcriptional regulator
MDYGHNVLHIYKVVALKGPLVLDEVANVSELTRSSSFRALKKLELGGWIRRQLDGRSFVITSLGEKIISEALPAFNFVEQLADLIASMELIKGIRTQIYHQITTSTVKLLEDSSSAMNSKEKAMNDFHDSALQCLQALQMARLALGSRRQYDFSEKELESIAYKIATVGFAVISEVECVVVPLEDKKGGVSFVVFSVQTGSSTSPTVCQQAASKLLLRARNKKVFGSFKALLQGPQCFF